MKSAVVELRNYALVSCLGLCVDVGLLLLLNSYFNVPYLIAAATSFTAGSVLGYFLCAHYVFPDDGGTRAHSLRLSLFLLSGGVGILINTLVMAMVVELLHAPVLAAKAVSAACTFFVGYLLRKRWVFGPAFPAP